MGGGKRGSASDEEGVLGGTSCDCNRIAKWREENDCVGRVDREEDVTLKV